MYTKDPECNCASQHKMHERLIGGVRRLQDRNSCHGYKAWSSRPEQAWARDESFQKQAESLGRLRSGAAQDAPRRDTNNGAEFLGVTCIPKMSRLRAMTYQAKAGRRRTQVPDHSRVTIRQRANSQGSSRDPRGKSGGLNHDPFSLPHTLDDNHS